MGWLPQFPPYLTIHSVSFKAHLEEDLGLLGVLEKVCPNENWGRLPEPLPQDRVAWHTAPPPSHTKGEGFVLRHADFTRTLDSWEFPRKASSPPPLSLPLYHLFIWLHWVLVVAYGI